ncbi:hypothetical protein FACS189460_1440 [Deltaproteobacteria bacterium]|nr:hypothetical protein FACS189460_1440 [Deltaproteobacteria bacterium]
MNETGAFNAANSIPGDLTKTLLSGLTALPQQALKATAVQMETQLQLQQQATALAAVAQMTGLGTRLDTVA